ncbi:AI-2E family transporter [Gracilibacillus caseinilyticus]|uniref:AI-2E family transporter n=1 Tax=Gracilibacillus caseinilyticus TaxID=2932256 RepID=UPI00350EE0F4
MKHLLQKKSIRTLITFILIFILVYLIYLSRFIFQPVGAYLAAIAVPIIGSGIIYYITSPIVNWLSRKKVPRFIGTMIVFLLLIAVITLIILFIAPIVQRQFSNFVDSVPKMVRSAQDIFELWQQNQNIIPPQFESAIQNVLDNISGYAEKITTGIISAIGQIFSFVFSIVLIPFFLYFMMMDGYKLVPFVSKFLSPKKADSFKTLTANINHTLSSFIQGQFFVSLCVGIMLYIGYVIIKLDYSLSLALFGLVMNFIPFIGPFLSAIPAIIVGFFQEPMMAVWATSVMVIAQQIESNLISPNIMGRALSIHPLTVITLILAAGGIAGFIGLLFIIPAYAVVKTVISHFYHEWKEKQPEKDPDLL